MDLLEVFAGDVGDGSLCPNRGRQRYEHSRDVHSRGLGKRLSRHGPDDIPGPLLRIHKEDDLAGGLGDPLTVVWFLDVVGQPTCPEPGRRRTGGHELARRPLFEFGQQGRGPDVIPQTRRREDKALVSVGFKQNKMRHIITPSHRHSVQTATHCALRHNITRPLDGSASNHLPPSSAQPHRESESVRKPVCQMPASQEYA